MNDQIQQLDKLVKDILANKSTHGVDRVLRLLEKELFLYQNNLSGRKAWEEHKKSFDTDKIQIGGGGHPLKGYLNIDIVPPADLVCDIREGIPVEDESCNFIFSEHCFEHLDYPTSVKKVSRECHRILKKGGSLVVGVPDAKFAIDCYIRDDQELFKEFIAKWYQKRNCLDDFNTPLDLVNYVFRDQDDDPTYNPHYWAYDFTKLKSMLTEAGFANVEPWEFDQNIANPKREWASVYVIAKK